MLMIVEVNADDVSIALALAWKFLCAVINPTSSVVKSTFDLSGTRSNCSKPAVPGSPNVAAPDFAEDKYELSPFCRKPSLLGNVTKTIFPKEF